MDNAAIFSKNQDGSGFSGEMQNWSTIRSILPEGWEQAAWETGAVKRKLTGYKGSVGNLLRCLFMYGGADQSMRMVSANAKKSNLGSFTPGNFRKKMIQSTKWLEWLCSNMLQKDNVFTQNLGDIPLKLIDSSIINCKGNNDQFRLHYEYSPAKYSMSGFNLSDAKGSGTGDSCRYFDLNIGDHLCCDAGYSYAKEFSYCQEKRAFLLTRLNSSLPLYNAEGEKIDLIKTFSTLHKELSQTEISAFVHDNKKRIPVRVCVIKKKEIDRQLSQKKKLQKASKKQTKIKEKTLVHCGFITLITTFDKSRFSTDEIFRIYRFRWQIELEFKRLKSIIKARKPPTIEPYVTKVWILIKLLTKIICDRLSALNGSFSPSAQKRIGG